MKIKPRPKPSSRRRKKKNTGQKRRIYGSDQNTRFTNTKKGELGKGGKGGEVKLQCGQCLGRVWGIGAILAEKQGDTRKKAGRKTGERAQLLMVLGIDCPKKEH